CFRQKGEQSHLMRGIIDEEIFLEVYFLTELSPLISIFQRNTQAQFGGCYCTFSHTDSSADEGAQHHKKSYGRFFNRVMILSVFIDRAEAIQKMGPRHLNLIKPQASVVHAIETSFMTVVFDSDSGKN